MRRVREIVLAIVLQAREPLPGRIVAAKAGITRRQAADALVALAYQGLIVRHGRKAHARWAAPTTPPNPFEPLERALYGPHTHPDGSREDR